MINGPTCVANKTFDKQSSIFNNKTHFEERETERRINLFLQSRRSNEAPCEKAKYVFNEIIIIGDFNYSRVIGRSLRYSAPQLSSERDMQKRTGHLLIRKLPGAKFHIPYHLPRWRLQMRISQDTKVK